MKNRFLAVVGALALVAGVSLVLVVVSRQAPARAAISTPWGEPDLQGIWYAFEDVPLQRPAKYAGREFRTDAEVAARDLDWVKRLAEGDKDPAKKLGRDRRAAAGTQEDVGGAYNAVWSPGKDNRRPSKRTSLIVDPPDGKVPPLTPEAQKRIAAFRDFQQDLLQGTPMGKPGPLFPRIAEPPPSYNLARLHRPPRGPEDRARSERCLGLSLPAFGGRNYNRIVQSPGYVAIYYEASGHAGANRVIPVGETRQAPLPKHIRQYLGDARGRWEGSTLVVETTNFTDKTDYQGSRENLRLTERFTRVDADTIRYELTVEDPTTWTKPWTVRADMGKQDDYQNRLFEPACHEGNYGLIGMLSGARAADKAFKEGRGPNPATQYVMYEGDAGSPEFEED